MEENIMGMFLAESWLFKNNAFSLFTKKNMAWLIFDKKFLYS